MTSFCHRVDSPLVPLGLSSWGFSLSRKRQASKQVITVLVNHHEGVTQKLLPSGSLPWFNPDLSLCSHSYFLVLVLITLNGSF